jgi:hypothetical protein
MINLLKDYDLYDKISFIFKFTYFNKLTLNIEVNKIYCLLFIAKIVCYCHFEINEK